MTKVVDLKIENRIGILTIQRPQALNALNSQVLSELELNFAEINKKTFDELRALIVTGAGEKAFVAGADIKEISSLDADQAEKFSERGQRILASFEILKVPVIAAVNGFALGGGLELALCCDVIIASENAKFGLPEVSLGLIPGFGGTVRLARVVGLNAARDLIFTGRVVAATEAKDLGLVSKIVPLAELMKSATDMANQMAGRSPLAVHAAKLSVLQGFDETRSQALKTEREFFQRLFNGGDVREGTSAFVEKRPPQFVGQ